MGGTVVTATPDAQPQTTTPDQTAQIPVAGPAQAQGASSGPSGAAGIQAGYNPPPGAGDDMQPQAPQSFLRSAGQHAAGTGALMLHGILSALGGTQDTTYSVDPSSGKLVASSIPSGPGMQFKRIIAGAVAGLAAGAGQTGPGHLGKALAAGTGAGMQQAQEKTAQAKQQAEQDYDQQQKALVQKAQMASLTQQTAASAWELSRKKIEAGQIDDAHQQARAQAIKDSGGFTLGHAPDFATFLKMHEQDPTIVKDHTQGLLVAIPHSNGDGMLDGVDIWKQPEDPDNKPLQQDAPIQREVAAKTPGADGPDGQPTWKTEMIPSGSMSVGAYSRLTAAVTNRQLDLAKQAQTTKDVQSQIKERNAEAAQKAGENATQIQRARIEAGARGNAGGAGGTGALNPMDPADRETILQGMQDGTADITKLFGNRNNSPLRAQYVAAMLQRDPNWTMAKYDAAHKAQVEFASTEGTHPGAQINSFNYMIGHGGDFMDQMNLLRQNRSPLLNKPLNWLKEHAEGDPAVSAVYVPMDNFRQESEKFIKGSNMTIPDQENAIKKLDLAQNLPTMEAVVKEMMGTGVIRLGGLNQGFKRSVGKDYPGLLDPASQQILAKAASGRDPYSVNLARTMQQHLPASAMGGAAAPQQRQTGPPPAVPAGKVWVQIPGSPPGFIDKTALAQFQKDHRNATVRQ